MPFVDPNDYKDLLGVEGRRVILTFSLLSPNKGIEFMINALPDIVQRFPDAEYLVLGVTHPNAKREKGEEYRLRLQRLARKIGVAEQSVSGALAHSLGTGKAIVSTPYWYAEELLDGGRGRLVPFRDASALAGAAVELLDKEAERRPT